MSNLPLSWGKPLETMANTGCGAWGHPRSAKGGDPQGAPARRRARAPSACWRGNGPPRLTVSWSERMTSPTGTEILPRLLREAAVEDHLQWAKA